MRSLTCSQHPWSWYPCSCTITALCLYSHWYLLLLVSTSRALSCLGAGSRVPHGLSPPHSTLVPTSGSQPVWSRSLQLLRSAWHQGCTTTHARLQHAQLSKLPPTACTMLPTMASPLPQLPAQCLVTAAASASLISIPSPASPAFSQPLLACLHLLQHGRQEVSVLCWVEKLPRARAWCLSFLPCSCSTVPRCDSAVTPQLLSPAFCPSPAVGKAWSPS